MIGSPNHVYRHLDGDGSVSGMPLPGISAELEAFIGQDFEKIGEPILDSAYSSPDLDAFSKAGIGIVGRGL